MALAHLDALPGSGIVYTLTVSAAEDIAAALREAGHAVQAYTGRTDPADREQLEAALRDNRVKALVATSALGMGFDKPDLGFVLHLGAPSSPVAYYQQVGRAGRGTDRADVLLMPGPEDKEVWAYFASASMPRQEQADAVLAALAASPRPLSTAALESVVDVRRTRLELLLKVLDVDGAVQRVPGGWAATGVPWTYDAERYARVSEAREREQVLMLEYERTAECRMAFLQESLDDPTAAPCRRCDGCSGTWFPTEIPDTAVTTARGRLERAGVELEPRAQWPSGMDRLGVPSRAGSRPVRPCTPGGPRPADRPRLGPAAARPAARRRRGRPGAAARVRAGPARLGLAGPAGCCRRPPLTAAATARGDHRPRSRRDRQAAVPRRPRPRRRRAGR